MNAPPDELYFNWLVEQVGGPEVSNPTRTYWRMLKKLYTTEFVWIVPNDDNRIADGKDLRYEFVDGSGLNDVDPGWVNLGCSMFELLWGLSLRLSFEAEGEPRDWFWELIDNSGLAMWYDNCPETFEPDKNISDILERIIWRTYKPNGDGGLFPLKNPTRDQTKIELWYQLNAYLQD